MIVRVCVCVCVPVGVSYTVDRRVAVMCACVYVCVHTLLGFYFSVAATEDFSVHSTQQHVLCCAVPLVDTLTDTDSLRTLDGASSCSRIDCSGFVLVGRNQRAFAVWVLL